MINRRELFEMGLSALTLPLLRTLSAATESSRNGGRLIRGQRFVGGTLRLHNFDVVDDCEFVDCTIDARGARGVQVLNSRFDCNSRAVH